MEQINREHPEYAIRKSVWQRCKDLYAGGEQFRQSADQYLVRRHKEPQDVYAERLNRVFYENYIGSIIDWYGATLMRREPILTCEGPNEAGKIFYNEFVEDCDLRGSNLAEFFRQRLTDALVYGRSYICVDFPRQRGPAGSRAEEDASGRSRAFLVDYTPEEVINWSHDDSGNLNWIVMRSSVLQQDCVSDSGWRRVTKWIYYDRDHYRIYVRDTAAGQDASIQLLDEGVHGLASLHRVPVFELKVADGLWLMNKAAALQLEHFNKSNALSWALTMGLFAMPVVYSERDFNQMLGESYYLQMGNNDRFGWTEPEGKVYQIAEQNLARLKDEIYRVCYLMLQAGGSQSAFWARSAASKQMDFGITQEVLRAFGDAIKETMKQVLRAIEAVRLDSLFLDVSGLDQFDIEDFGSDLEEAHGLLSLGIQSDTMKRQLFKKLVFKYFSDVRQELKNQIASEIDASFERK